MSEIGRSLNQREGASSKRKEESFSPRGSTKKELPQKERGGAPVREKTFQLFLAAEKGKSFRSRWEERGTHLWNRKGGI